MDPLHARRAAAAARSIAASQGLDVDDIVVLQDSNKLTTRLLPADVVARVAPVAHQDLAVELDLTRRLLDVGSPVMPPDPRVPARVHEADGFAVTFWCYGGVPADAVPATDYAGALQRLHAGLRTVDLATPHVLDRVSSAQALVASRNLTPRLADGDRRLLAQTLSRLGDAVAAVGRVQLLHGEPHPGNLLDSDDGLRFIDLETCCRGPVEFDVAHAPDEVALHYDGLDPVVLRQSRLLMIALVATWRWDADDRLPDGVRLGVEWVARLRAALADDPAR